MGRADGALDRLRGRRPQEPWRTRRHLAVLAAPGRVAIFQDGEFTHVYAPAEVQPVRLGMPQTVSRYVSPQRLRIDSIQIAHRPAFRIFPWQDADGVPDSMRPARETADD